MLMYRKVIEINGHIALSEQKPWIAATTIKDNILMEEAMNEDLLKKVIHFSCLESDLEILPKGI